MAHFTHPHLPTLQCTPAHRAPRLVRLPCSSRLVLLSVASHTGTPHPFTPGHHYHIPHAHSPHWFCCTHAPLQWTCAFSRTLETSQFMLRQRTPDMLYPIYSVLPTHTPFGHVPTHTRNVRQFLHFAAQRGWYVPPLFYHHSPRLPAFIRASMVPGIHYAAPCP